MSEKKDTFDVKKIGINSFMVYFNDKKIVFNIYDNELTMIKYSSGICCGNNWCLTYQNDGYLISSSNKFNVIKELIIRKLRNKIKLGIKCPLDAILTLPYN